MTQNLITSAFELVRDVEHGVLLLDTFHRLATREVRGPPPRGPAPTCVLPAVFSYSPLSDSLASTSVQSVPAAVWG